MGWRERFPLLPAGGGRQTLRGMLVLDKARALDRMVWLSQRRHNAVPADFLRSSPLLWRATPTGRRELAGEVVLQPSLRPTTVDTELVPLGATKTG
jgi:hypothetical protein